MSECCKLLFTVCIILSGCTNSDKTRQVLEASGYTDITITGYEFITCSKDDTSCTGFEAKSPSGRWVKGAVGCGLVFKGCTIRLL